MTYGMWYRKWSESVLELLSNMVREGGSVAGKAYTQNRKSLVLPGTNGIDGNLLNEWKREIHSMSKL